MGEKMMEEPMLGWLIMFGTTVFVLIIVALLIYGIYWMVDYLRGPL